ncbi:unknown [Bacteroides sp. CAG:598]|nr:unknown [Bacteroides sp. CAG:598]
MILGTYFRTILPIQQQDSSICYIERRHSCTYEVVTSRTVDNIQFLAIPLYMENGGKHRIAIFLLHRKVIADCILGGNSSATFYNTTLIEQRFCESGFTRAVIAKKSNVFDFIRLIYFHDI